MTTTSAAPDGTREDMALAFRGTAYFLRLLAQLPEIAYDEPGQPAAPADRRTTIAAVGYDARGWANLAFALRTGSRHPATFVAGEREAAISACVTLPGHALRHLVEHSAMHLAVEWRDLPAGGWGRVGLDGRGDPLPVSRTPWLRARQTWLAAVDLGIGGRFADFPPVVLERLVTEHGGTILLEGEQHQVRWRGSMLTGTLESIARHMLRGPIAPNDSTPPIPAHGPRPAARRPRVLASSRHPTTLSRHVGQPRSLKEQA